MNEQKLARLVLECHRRGYSIRHHLREMRTQHIASLASGAFGLALLQAADCDTLMWIVLGTGIGLFGAGWDVVSGREERLAVHREDHRLEQGGGHRPVGRAESGRRRFAGRSEIAGGLP